MYWTLVATHAAADTPVQVRTEQKHTTVHALMLRLLSISRAEFGSMQDCSRAFMQLHNNLHHSIHNRLLSSQGESGYERTLEFADLTDITCMHTSIRTNKAFLEEAAGFWCKAILAASSEAT